MTETLTIEQQIEQAKAAAATHTNAQGQALAAPGAGNTGTAVAMPTAGGKRLDDEDMMLGGIAVDFWFKPKEFGLQIGTAASLIPSFEAELDLREKLNNFAIKFGNPATYLKSYDGVTCAQGGSWDSAIARAKAVESNARPYNSVDIPVTILTDIKGSDGAILAKAGQRGGYATSTTNWQNWETFYNMCKAGGFNPKNPDPNKCVVKVKIGFQRRTNTKGNAWGVCTFELLGFVEESGE